MEDNGKSREEYDNVVLEQCRAKNVDLIVLAGWMRVLTSGFINNYINKIINIHPALPGKYPGTNAIKRAFNDFQEGKGGTTGVMVHIVVEEVDAGEVIDLVEVPIYKEDRYDMLEERVRRNHF